MRILYVNNDGGGFADFTEIEQGTTVGKFFSQRVPDRKAEDYLIRVNRMPVSADDVLNEGDRITITPTKIQGAKEQRNACAV
jgi:sulfur carrier protein ThiS